MSRSDIGDIKGFIDGIDGEPDSRVRVFAAAMAILVQGYRHYYGSGGSEEAAEEVGAVAAMSLVVIRLRDSNEEYRSEQKESRSEIDRLRKAVTEWQRANREEAVATNKAEAKAEASKAEAMALRQDLREARDEIEFLRVQLSERKLAIVKGGDQ